MDDDAQSVVSELTQQTQQTTQTTQSAKDELTVCVKRWIRADQDLAQAKKAVLALKTQKQALTQDLMGLMKQHKIDCLDMHGGSLVYKRRTTKKPISAKFLSAQLATLYAEQPDVARHIARHILDNRAQVVKEDIARETAT